MKICHKEFYCTTYNKCSLLYFGSKNTNNYFKTNNSINKLNFPSDLTMLRTLLVLS